MDRWRCYIDISIDIDIDIDIDMKILIEISEKRGRKREKEREVPRVEGCERMKDRAESSLSSSRSTTDPLQTVTIPATTPAHSSSKPCGIDAPHDSARPGGNLDMHMHCICYAYEHMGMHTCMHACMQTDRHACMRTRKRTAIHICAMDRRVKVNAES